MEARAKLPAKVRNRWAAVNKIVNCVSKHEVDLTPDPLCIFLVPLCHSLRPPHPSTLSNTCFYCFSVPLCHPPCLFHSFLFLVCFIHSLERVSSAKRTIRFRGYTANLASVPLQLRLCSLVLRQTREYDIPSPKLPLRLPGQILLRMPAPPV